MSQSQFLDMLKKIKKIECIQTQLHELTGHRTYPCSLYLQHFLPISHRQMQYMQFLSSHDFNKTTIL
jgi:hypothetical protein